MGLFDLICDVAEVATNVGKVVLAPVDVIAGGAKAATKAAADFAEDAKRAMTE